MQKPTSKQIVIITTIAMTPLFIFFLWSQLHLTARQELVLKIDANSQQWEALNAQIETLKATQSELKATNDELRASPLFTLAE